MRLLYLLRHATPLDGEPDQNDFDRPLAPRGNEEARAVGRLLGRLTAEEGLAAVRCSPSRRTLETHAALAPFLPEVGDMETPDSLYGASRDELLATIGDVDPDRTSLLVIAHAPGIAMLAFDLATGGESEAVARLGRSYPPAALSVLAFERDDWALGAAPGRLVAFETPTRLD